MEKAKKNIYLIIGLGFVIFLSFGINIYANHTDQIVTIEDNIKLVLAIITFTGILLNLIFASKGASKDDVVKVDNKVDKVKYDLDEFTLRYKNEKDKDKEILDYMLVGLKDTNEMMKTKNDIHDLGKLIKRKSKYIIEENPGIEENKEMFIIEVCNEISRIITEEYAYGLDDIDLVDFQKDLNNKVDIITGGLKLNDKVCIKGIVKDNIEKYITRLSGIQGIKNGERRERFENETMRFINLLVKSINKNKKTAA